MLKTSYFAFNCVLVLTIITDCLQCDFDYEYSFKAVGWLKLYTMPATWEAAFLRCHNDGTVLASPLNKPLANAIQSQIDRFGENIFLGIHDLHSKGHFVSVEGMPLSDMDIKWGSHDVAGTGDCLTMSADGNVYYSSCNDPLPYVCYYKADNRTMNECGTFDDEYHLNQRTGSCYKVHRENLNWSDAYWLCAYEGSHLVILNDEVEANFIKTMFPEEVDQYFRFHVGLRAWGIERVWTTIHGQGMDKVYNNWTSGQPDNLGGIQNRGAFLKNGYLDGVGSEELQFVCEKSPKSKWQC